MLNRPTAAFPSYAAVPWGLVAFFGLGACTAAGRDDDQSHWAMHADALGLRDIAGETAPELGRYAANYGDDGQSHAFAQARSEFTTQITHALTGLVNAQTPPRRRATIANAVRMQMAHMLEPHAFALGLHDSAGITAFVNDVVDRAIPPLDGGPYPPEAPSKLARPSDWRLVVGARVRHALAGARESLATLAAIAMSLELEAALQTRRTLVARISTHDNHLARGQSISGMVDASLRQIYEQRYPAEKGAPAFELGYTVFLARILEVMASPNPSVALTAELNEIIGEAVRSSYGPGPR